MNKINFSIILSVFIFLGSTASAGEFFLIKNGKSCAGILLPENPSHTEKYAAEELSRYAEKMTGTPIPIYRGRKNLPASLPTITFSLKGKKTGIPASHPGENAIKEDGYAISAQNGKGLHITGARPRSLLYGVYHILKNNGILFLYPHPEGKGDHIPAGKNLSFPEGVCVRNPVFSFRKMTLNGGSLKNQHTYEWFLRNGLQLHIFGTRHTPDILKLDPIPFTGGHAMATALVGEEGGKFKERRAKLLREKPELFGLVNGKRTIAGNERGCCQPCTSNPETLERMRNNIRKILARFNGRENIRTICNDDHLIWCECANCKKLDDPKAPRENRHADRYWHFVNYMAKHLLTEKNPNQKLKVLAYQTFRFPPKTIQPDPRVLVEICPHYRCYIHPLTDPACPVNAATFRKMFESWAARTKKLSTFEYHTQMPGSTRYLPMERAWIRDMKYYRELGLAGFGFITRAAYSDFGPRNSLFNLHMFMSLWQQHYITGFLAWDMDKDVEKELEKINAAFYGNAWKVMKIYRKELEKALYAPKVHMKYGTNDMTLGRCLDSPGLLEKLEKYLKDAQNLVKNSPLHLERVRQEEFFFRESWVKAYLVYKEVKNKEYKVNRRKSNIILDGKLTESDWKNAAAVTNFITNREHQEIADPPTSVKMLFDRDNLYLGVECRKVPGKSPQDAPGNGIPAAMRGSHLEFFLVPPYLGRRYYHFGISRNGKRFAALTVNSKNRDEKIAVPFQCKITEDKEKWVAEIRFPLTAPFRKLYDGELWKVNFGRSAVNPQGILRGSSASGGIFHGSEHYRTALFGEKTILQNGNMEEVTKPTLRKNVKKEWTYLSSEVPDCWVFGPYNPGNLQLHKGNAAPSGKNYIHISGRNAFIGQRLSIPSGVKEVFLSMKVRGKAEIYSRIYGRKQAQKGFLKKVDTKGKWETLSGNIPLPENASFFWIRITGEVDLDDVSIQELEKPDENMPTADKHK